MKPYLRMHTDKGKFRAAIGKVLPDAHNMMIFNDRHEGTPTRRLKVWLGAECSLQQATDIVVAAHELFEGRVISMYRKPNGRALYLYLADRADQARRFTTIVGWKSGRMVTRIHSSSWSVSQAISRGR